TDSSHRVQPPTVLRKGTLVRVDQEHEWVIGTLVRPFAVTRTDTVVLVHCNTCANQSFPGNTLAALAVGTGASRATHVAYGIAGGAGAGLSLGALLGRYALYAGNETRGGNPGTGAVLGGLLGAGVGALVGAALPPSLHWITLDLR
ncbi:MAG TPA: hypothetical protein VLI40_02070, partial [Gemmatimonadaceae bacterium]|nr:hypothetical protein [Gemmatimonadaceae bacterium]